MTMITLQAITREQADEVLEAIYEADRSSTYTNSRRAVSGTSITAQARHNPAHKGNTYTWDVEISSGHYSDTSLMGLVPVDLREFTVQPA